MYSGSRRLGLSSQLHRDDGVATYRRHAGAPIRLYAHDPAQGARRVLASRPRRQFADGRTTSAVARLTLSSALNLSPAFVWIPRERVCARSSRRGRSTRSRSLRKRATLMRRLPSPVLSLRLDSDPAGINCECAPTQRRHFTRQTVSSRQNELVSIERVPRDAIPAAPPGSAGAIMSLFVSSIADESPYKAIKG